MTIERYSVSVLQECIDLQNKKATDYQNSNSRIKQADYYPNGCLTIHDIMHAKMLRMKSVMEAMLKAVSTLLRCGRFMVIWVPAADQ